MRTSENQRLATSVTVKELQKNYNKLQALKNVSIEVKENEFFTLLGPSGCGKTTLLRSIAGFEVPDKGHIYFNGKDVTHLPPWEKNIGFVFQNYALWPNKTVFQNIAYGLQLRKKDSRFIKDKVAWSLELVGLQGVEKKYPEEMSGGQQQRVAIARALVIDPEILLLDEPLSNLDAKLRISLRKQIRSIQKSLGISAIYVTHDQEEALEISDRIAVMNKGEVLQIDGPEEIYNNPSDLFVADFIGKANFLTGTVKDWNFITGGKSFKLDPPPDKEGKATLFIRPESLSPAASSSTGLSFEGKVVHRYYLGNLKRYLIEIDRDLTLLWETGFDYSENETIHLKAEKYAFYYA